VDLAAVEFRKTFKGLAAVFVEEREHRNGDEDLVRMEAGIMAVEIADLGLLDGLDHILGDELYLVVYAGEMLCGIENQRGGGAEQRAGLGGYQCPVCKLNSGGCNTAFCLSLACCYRASSEVGCYAGLVHQELELVDFILGGAPFGESVESCVVAADDFVPGSLAAGLLVTHTASYHIDSHIGRGLVWILSVDALEESIQNGKNLDVAVVVDGYLAVGLEMEGVDYVDVVKIGSGGLVGEVDWMFEGEVPYGESLELCVAGLHAAFVLLVELGEADGHLAGAGAWGGHDDELAGGLDKVVAAEAVFGVYEGYIVGIAFDSIMVVNLDSEPFESLTVGVG